MPGRRGKFCSHVSNVQGGNSLWKWANVLKAKNSHLLQIKVEFGEEYYLPGILGKENFLVSLPGRKDIKQGLRIF